MNDAAHVVWTLSFYFLPAHTLIQLERVCKGWKELVHDDSQTLARWGTKKYPLWWWAQRCCRTCDTDQRPMFGVREHYYACTRCVQRYWVRVREEEAALFSVRTPGGTYALPSSGLIA